MRQPPQALQLLDDWLRVCPAGNTPAMQAYAASQLSTIIGRPVTPDAAMARRWWALLSRQEEYGAPANEHGCFPAEESVLTHFALLEHPPLHADVLAMNGGHTPSCWPAPYQFAACLTHDADVVQALPWRERLRRLTRGDLPVSRQQLLRWAVAAGVFFLKQQLTQTTPSLYDVWMREEARYGFHSTFLVMPEHYASPTPYDHFHQYDEHVTYQGHVITFTEASREVQSAGWEIGLHGSYASAFDESILADEKARLEEMLHAPVISTRQHYLRFAIDRKPAIHARIGLAVDSTLGYATTLGCRAGLAFPYFWPHAPEVLEAPLVIHDVAFLRGIRGSESPTAQIARACALIRQVAAVGGLVTLSWHTNPDFPHALAGYRALLHTIAELGGWGCTMRELNAWWRARHASMHHQTSSRLPQNI